MPRCGYCIARQPVDAPYRKRTEQAAQPRPTDKCLVQAGLMERCIRSTNASHADR